MERESFEDLEAAKVMNKYFVAIKVDREERPDIDHLYMEFCQALTGSGGWPLTILMTPEKEPFFAGTYFPKTQKYGRIGLIELLEQTGNLWLTQESRVRQSARETVQAIQAHKAPLSQDALAATLKDARKANELADWGEQALGQAYHSLRRSFDSRYGGFGAAPKFPSPHVLGFLLRYAHKHPESEALNMVTKTLDGMATGGIYDHIGFGFARYSTDQKWLVPHFEKMLYDNALLALAYLESYQMQHRENDAQKAREIFTYVLRDMTSPQGGFYSAEDADSEGIEGKFYVWTRSEITGILGKDHGEIFCSAFDITDNGNFEGKNIPNRSQSDWPALAKKFNLSLEELLNILESSRQKLFQAREKRIHPHKDDKILTSWNGLMIVALAKASQILMDNAYLEAAEKALQFILQNLRREDGRLLARYRDGQAGYLGYLDDYAFLVWALLELYTTGGKAVYLQTALEFQEEQNSLFGDQADGGYFLTGSDGEELLFRPKEFYDGALPSGNSVSALNLLRFSRITAEPKWEERAQRHLSVFSKSFGEHPTGYTAFLQAIQFALYGTQELVLAGPLDAPSLPQMRKVYFSDFHPFATLLYQEGTIGNYLPWMKEYSSIEDTTTAYLCQNLACQAPVTSPENLATLLNQT